MTNWLDRPLTKKEIKELEEWDRTSSFILNAAIVFFIVCCFIALLLLLKQCFSIKGFLL